jgi:ATP-dependent Clp protease adapter protein ClpS/Zn-dependent protease
MRFHLLGIPVRVQPMFLIVTLIIGGARPREAVAWLALVFVSVLIHEMGHALAARWLFDARPSIELSGFGGLTTWDAPAGRSWKRRILVSLAGPGAGFVFGALVWLVAAMGVGAGPSGQSLLRQLLWINVGWGALNLLPMLPLDGGNVLAALVTRDNAGHDQWLVRIISLCVAAAATLWALQTRLSVAAMIAAYAVVANGRVLFGKWAERRDSEMQPRIQAAWAAVHAGRARDAVADLEALLPSLRTDAVRAEAIEVLARAHLQAGEADRAAQVLTWMPGGFRPSLATRVLVAAAPASGSEAGELLHLDAALSPALERVLEDAWADARRRGHEWCAPEHVLAALARDAAGAAFLGSCGVDVVHLDSAMAASLEQLDSTDRRAGPKTPGFDQTLGRVLLRALRATAHRSQSRLETGDVLASLLAEPKLPATVLLAAEGLSRIRVLRVLSHGTPDFSPGETGSPSGRAAVVLHNDDYTTMEFVVEILEQVLGIARAEAEAVMLRVHADGSAIGCVLDDGDARARIREAHARAEAAGFPLMLTLTPA